MLGADAVAAVIVHGSLTLGDYVQGRSDIDVLAIVERPLGGEQLVALTEAVAAESSRVPARFDFRVVTREVAAAPTIAPPMELYVAAQPVAEHALQIEKHHPGERDLVVEFAVCRAHGRSLVGPAPSELISVVPDEWVLEVGDAVIREWQTLEFDPAHAELMVLTACRIWRFSEERRHSSKASAGEWALERDPALQAVRDALRRRLVDPAFPIEEGPVRHLLAVVRGRLEGR